MIEEFDKNKMEQTTKGRIDYDTSLFAMLFSHRFGPIPPHLVGALRERLGYKTDDEVDEMIKTGRVNGIHS